MKDEWHPLFPCDFDYLKAPAVTDQIREAVVHRHESMDIFVGGGRGSGKSTVAMSLALQIDPEFNLDRWCFSSDDFIEQMHSHQKPGSVVVFDDIGTSIGSSSRKWQSKVSEQISDTMQVNRTDGIITIGTSLDFNRLELRLRDGFKIFVNPMRKLSAGETGHDALGVLCELRVKNVDPYTGKTTYQHWRYSAGGRITSHVFIHPPVPIWHAYQGRRASFLDILKQSRQKEVDNARNDVTPATDKEWAAYLHISPMKYGSLKSLIKYVAGNPDITKPALIKECGNILGVEASVVEKRIRSLVDDNVLVKRSLTGSRSAVDQVYDIGDVGASIVEGGQIP